MPSGGRRRAAVEDVHELAAAMPHVTVYPGTGSNAVYQVGGKSFIFFRNPRPDAVDPQTGERYTDVIVFWVPSEADKQALVADESNPFFTTAHFNGHSFGAGAGICSSVSSPVTSSPKSSRTPGSRGRHRGERACGSRPTDWRSELTVTSMTTPANSVAHPCPQQEQP